MPFLQKKPQTSVSAPLFTVGLNKTKLIVGLGNPGKKFDNTRHNVGFNGVDVFVNSQDFGGWIDKKDLKCHITETTLGDTRVFVIKPTTFMNVSGDAVEAVINFYKLNLKDMVVVYDELDINFGQIRTRVGGSSAGHNGVKSIIAKLGEDFGRIRVGIGPVEPEQMSDSSFVLGKFTKEQQALLKPIANEISAILTEYIFGNVLPHETRTVST